MTKLLKVLAAASAASFTSSIALADDFIDACVAGAPSDYDGDAEAACQCIADAADDDMKAAMIEATENGDAPSDEMNEIIEGCA